MKRRDFFRFFSNKEEITNPSFALQSSRKSSMTGYEPYIGEIILVPYTFAPRGFAKCEGQLLPIAQNTALFSILGTTYGGNGQTTFGLPDLRGAMAIGAGQGAGLSPRDLGEKAGSANLTVLANQLPAQVFSAKEVEVRGVGGSEATGLAKGKVSGTNALSIPNNSPVAVNNMPPYQGLQYVIALHGIFPPRW